MDNIFIYEQGRAVPKEAKKPIKGGRLKGMTDINPMWRIRKLTEIFGACGIGWWYEVVDKRIEFDEISNQKAAFVDILLFYQIDGQTSHGIPGTGGASFVARESSGYFMSDECFKMATTDAISVAAKALGIGADVYWEAGRTKYTTDDGKPTGRAQDGEQDNRKESVAETPRGDAAPVKVYRCEICGQQIKEYISPRDNKPVTVEQHAKGSLNRYKRVLCLDCINKLKSDDKDHSE